MKKILIIIPLFLLLAAGCNGNQNKTADGSSVLYNKKLQIGSRTLNVQVVSSSQDMAQGLSGRSSMKDSEGMLFELGQTGIPQFWMKDMEYNLDMIWIKDSRVVEITKDIPAPSGKISDDELVTYSPSSPVGGVLEVNAGWTKKNNVTIGDVVKLQN